MLILTSPAKTQNYSSDWKSFLTTEPFFQKEANQIAKLLASFSKKKLAEVLHVSEKLAELNYNRYNQWGKQSQKPAILAYVGSLFQQMNPQTYDREQQKYAQQSICVLTGLYGLIRPYDLIEAYRLEMKAPIEVGTAKNLYEFWGEKLTSYLESEIKTHNHPFILDLASNEYAKHIHRNLLTVPTIPVIFKHEKNGTTSIIGLLSKIARGHMMEFCVTRKITTINEVKKFNVDGYKLTDETDTSVTFTKKV